MTEVLDEADEMFVDYDPAPGRQFIRVAEPEREVIVLPTEEEDRLSFERIRKAEDKLMEQATQILDGAMHFGDLDEEAMQAKEPPAEWVASMGKRRAAKCFRIAKASWMAAKDAPVALKIAQALHGSISQARSAKEVAKVQPLNIAFVQLSAPLPDFPRRIVDMKEGK